MEDKTNLFSSVIERAEEYGKATMELYQLKAIDKAADVVSSATAAMAVSILGVFFFLILNIALGLWIGEEVGKTYLGFFILAGIYAILGIILYVFRNELIKTPVNNSIINQALK